MGIPPVKVEVHNEVIETRSGTSKNGKDWVMHEQDVWVYLTGEPFPTKAVVQLPEVSNGKPQAMKKGVYDLDLTLCMKIGNFHGIEVESRKVYAAMAYKGEIPK